MPRLFAELSREHDPFLVRRDVHVRFDATLTGDVVMLLHADELLAREGAVGAYAEKVDPLPIARIRDLRGISAVAREQRVIA